MGQGKQEHEDHKWSFDSLFTKYIVIRESPPDRHEPGRKGVVRSQGRTLLD